MKYTKGMRVRCLKDYHTGRQFTAGKEYVIRVDDDEVCRVIADDSGEPNGWNGEFFEIVARAFKVGDRVVVTECVEGEVPLIGKAGVVTGKTGWQGTISVKLDDGCEFYFAHSEIKHAALTIQAGKFYKTRDGRKVGPMENNPSKNDFWPFKWSRYHYRDDGHSCFDNLGSNHRKADDLIAEWVDEPAAAQPVAEQPAAKAAGGGFKEGDRIRLISDPVRGCRLGDEFVAVARPEASGGYPSSVHFTAKDGSIGWRPGSYFELVTPAASPSTPAIVCLMDNGRPLPAERPHVHPSTSAAEREAARLADKYKGKEFAVFELGSSCRKEPEYAHEWQRLAGKDKAGAIASLKRQAGITTAQARRIVYDLAA